VTNWTITPGALHDEAPGLWFGVNGDDHGEGDKHDERHYASQVSALHFLFGHKVKIGDSVKIAGTTEEQVKGQTYDLKLVKDGTRLVHSVGDQDFSQVDELVGWLDFTLRPGDTLKYHHAD
jgi:hypothetical protein